MLKLVDNCCEGALNVQPSLETKVQFEAKGTNKEDMVRSIHESNEYEISLPVATLHLIRKT